MPHFLANSIWSIKMNIFLEKNMLILPYYARLANIYHFFWLFLLTKDEQYFNRKWKNFTNCLLLAVRENFPVGFWGKLLWKLGIVPSMTAWPSFHVGHPTKPGFHSSRPQNATGEFSITVKSRQLFSLFVGILFILSSKNSLKKLIICQSWTTYQNWYVFLKRYAFLFFKCCWQEINLQRLTI